MSNYALADAKNQWFADRYRGSKIDPNCGVLHTTEGTDWPSYGGGASAPHYTAKPDAKAKRLRWRAHFPDEMSSRALRNLSGGVETNTLNAIQVELIGTCSPGTRDAWKRMGLRQDADFIFWPEAPAWALQDLAAFIADMHQRHGIPIQGPGLWQAYPASYGATSNRFTFAEWRTFEGWCGHQHVPENTHGDPGSLPWKDVQRRALALATPHKSATLRVGTWNVGNETGVLAALVQLLTEHNVGVIGLQEVGDRGPALEAAARRTGAELIRDPSRGGGKCALLIREGLTVLDADWTPCTPRTYVGPLGAGGSTMDAKWIVSAKITLPEVGRVLNVGASHKVPSVTRPPFPGRAKRRELYGKHVAAEVAWVESLRGHGPVVLLEDANATPDYFQLEPLDKAGMQCFTAPSHGRRAIDHVRVLDQDKTEVLDVEALNGFPGDHRPVIADLLVTPNLRRLP